MSTTEANMPGKERPSNNIQGEPQNPSPLPAELAGFLKDKPFACLMQSTDFGTVFVVKMPGGEIDSVRGRVPIHLGHELYEHPAAPVIRTVMTIYDQPDNPVALETFTNIGDQQQRLEFASLVNQKDFLILFYDEALRHRLAKRVNYGGGKVSRQILTRAEEILARIPQGQLDFDQAKQDVMEQTKL